jgi:hypothetical protein
VQVSARWEYLKLLVEAMDWQAGRVSHNRGPTKTLGSLVRLLDSIKAQTLSQQEPIFRVDIEDEDFEIVNEALEDYYLFSHGTFFVDTDSFVELIQVFRDAEDSCLVAAGKKPPVRESLDAPHVGQRLG